MPIPSKYSDAQIESLMQEIQLIFEHENAGTDLQFMVLGNFTTHLLNRLPQAQRVAIADSFIKALRSSITSDEH